MTHRTIYLIRHGQYDPEAKDKPEEGRLSAIGQEQARRTAEHLACIPFTAVHASDLPRAVETAGYILRQRPQLALQTSELLREITPPLPYLAIKNLKDVSPEQMYADRLRVEQAYAAYFCPAGEADAVEAIICHGNVIRYLVCRALSVPPLVWMNMEIYNCSISVVELDLQGNSILLSYNESGHLSEELKTQNLSPMGIGRKYAQPDVQPDPEAR